MLRILSSLITILLLTNIAYTSEFTCTTGKIEQISFGKMLSEKSSYCYNKTLTNLISLNCYKTHCEKTLSNTKYKIQDLISTVGKPGFKLCNKLNGNPEIITFYVSNISYKLDRCLFTNGNYVDTDYLLSLFLER
jgi:hypothetical protein